MTEMREEQAARSSSSRENLDTFHHWLTAPIVFGLLTLLMFGDLLYTSQRVISDDRCDVSLQFLHWREFGFSELRHGSLALWNPHVYCGAPYFAGFQSALLYPPNWLHLLLNVSLAINWVVAIHFFCAGFFTYLWCRGRGIGISGSILAGMMFMFSGVFFLHVYAGHLPNLAAMIWTPLLLLTIDKLADTGSLKWSALGVFAATMQILAGHPQYLYYTGIIVAIYAALRTRRWQVPAGFAIMYIGAVLIAAVQLFAGFAATAECARAAGAGYSFASTFALPPAHFLTWIAPTFFGNVWGPREIQNQLPYWSAGYLWETSLFVSISGLTLAVLGALRGRWSKTGIILVMAVVCFILALGRHTFVYRPLFNWLPEFDKFRGTSKFSYLGDLFICMLAGIGFDGLLKQRRVSFWFLGVAAGFALILFAFGAVIFASGGDDPHGAWGNYVAHTIETSVAAGEQMIPRPYRLNGTPQFVADTASQAAGALYLAGFVILVVVTLLWSTRIRQFLAYGLIIVAGIELFCFARTVRATFDPAVAMKLPAMWREPIARLDRDQRILIIPPLPERGMSVDFDELTGDDPFILKRYAELVYVSQGMKRSEASQNLSFDKFNPAVFQILRCGMICFASKEFPLVAPLPDIQQKPFRVPLPVATLRSDCVRISDPDTLLNYLAAGPFDPTSEVLLESAPNMPIVAGADSGTVKVVSQAADRLELEADVHRAAILLVTNNFSTGWRVRPIDSPQHDFQVMPANYCQIGVPLMAGKHHLILEYSPVAFRVGRWVSVTALLGYVIWVVLLIRFRNHTLKKGRHLNRLKGAKFERMPI